MAIKNLIQLRKGSASEWSSVNPVLASGEPGYDTTNNTIKIGDGTSPWNTLSTLSVDLDTSLVAGTGISLDYSSTTNSLYINTTGNYASSAHSHIISDISGLQTSLDGKQVSGNYATSSHTHTSSNITDFNSSVSGLLPVTNIVAGSNVTVSSASGAYTVNSIPLISYSATSGFPASGVSTSYYLASDSSRIYQWTGSQYVEIGSPPTTVSANDPTAGLTLLHPFLLGGM